jgi:hypothetical protein
MMIATGLAVMHAPSAEKEGGGVSESAPLAKLIPR